MSAARHACDDGGFRRPEPATAGRRAASTLLLFGGLVVAAAGVLGGPGQRAGATVSAQPPDYRVHLPLALRHGVREELPRATPVVPATATATATALAAATAEPSATPSATEVDATPTATEPPTATATATAALACANLVRNGDYESGAVQWTLSVTGQRQNPALAIQERSAVPVPPHGGNWLAWLGGANESFFELRTVTLLNYEPADIVQARVRFHVALITQEVSDRRPNDTMTVRLEGDRRTLSVPDAQRSEEDFAAQRAWVEVAVDITDIARADRVRYLGLEARGDQTAASWFYFDDVALEVCTPAG